MDEESPKEESSAFRQCWPKAKHHASVGASFVQKHTLLFTLLLVLLLQVLPNPGGAYPWGGIWMRAQSEKLSLADQAAASTIDNFVRQQAAQVVAQQYPNLPDTNRQKLINDVTAKIMTDQKAELDSQRAILAQQVRDHYQYEENGRKFTYMPDIDPYFYLRYVRNIVEKGQIYDELNDGQAWDNHMSAPFGTSVEANWHPYTVAATYWGYRLLDPKISLMEAANYQPLIIIFISIALMFLLTRRIAGNFAGVVSATLLGLLPAVVGRTAWGHPDTDTYNILFPTLAFWLIVETLLADTFRKRMIFAALTGASIGLYMKFWSGWWYVLYFIIGALVIALLFEIILNLKKGFSAVKSDPHVRKFLGIIAVIFITCAIVAVTFGTWNTFKSGVTQGGIRFTAIKDASLPTLWPNVFTTVAELNASSLSGVVDAAGGTLIFFIGMLGAMLLLFKGSRKEQHVFEHPYDWVWPILLVLIAVGVSKAWYTFIIVMCLLVGLLVLYKKYHLRDHDIVIGVLLAIWFAGTAYAGIKGVRFGMLIGPAVSVAFGAAAGTLYTMLAPWAKQHLKVKHTITAALVIIVFGLFIIGPTSSGPHLVKNAYAVGSQDTPIVNDAWYNVLTKIKQESKPDAVINSWWDFGHHFKYFADRQVTFDGASQNAPQAHWIGKVLQTHDEHEAVAILRMLDCGGNSAYDVVYNKTKDPIVSINTVKEIIMLDDGEAQKYAQDKGVPEITTYTHCDPPENFFITSADMVSKSQVWSHFGLWDFKRAELWLRWRFTNEASAVPQIMERFNWTKEMAEKEYRETAEQVANGIEPRSGSTGSPEDIANQWISPWISYINGPETCKTQGSLMQCGSVLLNFSAKKGQAAVPGGIAFASEWVSYDRQGNVTRTKLEGGNEQLIIITWPQGGDTMGMGQLRELSESMFTRLFFMNGLGLEHFDHFAEDNQLFGGKVSVWKVDWQGTDKRIPSDVAPKTNVTSGANVKLNYIGYLENGTVFDSSILNWQQNNVTPLSSFNVDTNPLAIAFGEPGLITGFTRIEGMKRGEEKIITIPPDEAYGTDPSKHPLGNKTLKFKIRIESVE